MQQLWPPPPPPRLCTRGCGFTFRTPASVHSWSSFYLASERSELSTPEWPTSTTDGRVIAQALRPCDNQSMQTVLIPTSREGSGSLTRGTLRALGLIPIARSIRARADLELDMATIVRAHQLRSPRTSIACDWTAAALWGLPLPSVIGMDIDAIPICLSSLPDDAHDRCTGVRGRRLDIPRAHVATVNAIHVTSVPRTWLDCSAFVSREFSVAMADDALHRHLCDAAELAQIVEWGRGRRGVRTARAALELADGRSESPRESWLRASLILHGVPHPEVNLDVFANRHWLARVDLAWPEYRVIVEYDGREHHGPKQREHDVRRRTRLAKAGWRVLVFRNEDLGDMTGVAQQVFRALRAGGYPG